VVCRVDALEPAAASHGGSGTLLGALAHGIPQLCLPQAADQFRYAQACAAAGAGIALIGADATTDRIEAALRRLLDAPTAPQRQATCR